MIAAELRGGGKPSLNEALGWIGSRVDDVFGSAIGRLEDVWIDPATGEPRWLLVKEGRFGGRSTLVPFDQATPGDDTVWIPYERSVVREAPQIEPGVPLTQQVEATLRNHYAANTAAAVAHGYQSTGREAEQEGPPDSRATSATVRLATAGTPPEPPPLPLRPAPPIDAPPGREPQDEQYGYEPAAEGRPPSPSPFPPPPQPAAGYQPPAELGQSMQQGSRPSPPESGPPAQPGPQQPPGQPPPPQPGSQQPPPAQPAAPVPQQPPPGQPPQPWPQQPPRQQVPPEQPQPQQPVGYEPRAHPGQPQQQPPYGYEPQPPAPVPLTPPPLAGGGYRPPPLQQVPPPPPEPDPLDVLAGLPPGHMVEIELSGSLTISGELRHARVVPPGDPSSRR